MARIIGYLLILAASIFFYSSCAKKCYKCEKIDYCVDCTTTDKNSGSLRSFRSFCGDEKGLEIFEKDFNNTWVAHANVQCNQYQRIADTREECLSRNDAEDDIFILELSGYTCE